MPKGHHWPHYSHRAPSMCVLLDLIDQCANVTCMKTLALFVSLL